MDKRGQDGRERLYSELASQTGVAAEDVRKVLSALGVDRHFDEASKHLGTTPTVKDLRLAWRISDSTVSV